MMVAGRELDALVAEKVMGCERKISTLPEQRERDPAGACWCGPEPYGGSTGRGGIHSASYLGLGTREIAPYSTSIAAAWEVVDHVTAHPLDNHVGQPMLHELRQCALGQWQCSFCSDFGYTEPARADTPPLAICLAALAAVGALPTPQEDG